MPKSEQLIKLTDSFNNININNLNIQEAPKFLLRCMKDINKDNLGYFKYIDLIKFMLNNYDNPKYYKGFGINSEININNYWNYAKSHSTAYVPNFSSYYILIN